ncbi:MAG: hypothetical protein WCY19_02690 [Candidatus Gastranaerophilaceae bacterium]
MNEKQKISAEELQRISENAHYKNFYLPGYSITEDVAIQKVILLANRILHLSIKQKKNFKTLFGYKALSKLMWITYDMDIDLDGPFNVFEYIDDENIENIDYCLDNPIFENPKLYFRKNPGRHSINKKLIKLVNEIEETDPIYFLETFGSKINVLNLLYEDSSFKENLVDGDLIDFYFKFDVQYGISRRMQNNSTVKAIFHVFNFENESIRTYVWTYELKTFLKEESKPKLVSFVNSIDKFYETDFSDL